MSADNTIGIPDIASVCTWINQRSNQLTGQQESTDFQITEHERELAEIEARMAEIGSSLGLLRADKSAIERQKREVTVLVDTITALEYGARNEQGDVSLLAQLLLEDLLRKTNTTRTPEQVQQLAKRVASNGAAMPWGLRNFNPPYALESGVGLFVQEGDTFSYAFASAPSKDAQFARHMAFARIETGNKRLAQFEAFFSLKGLTSGGISVASANILGYGMYGGMPIISEADKLEYHSDLSVLGLPQFIAAVRAQAQA